MGLTLSLMWVQITFMFGTCYWNMPKPKCFQRFLGVYNSLFRLVEIIILNMDIVRIFFIDVLNDSPDKQAKTHAKILALTKTRLPINL